MFLPEDDFSRRGADTEETGTGEGKSKKTERERRQHFVRLLNSALQALQNNYIC